jgi:hypothetical protein
LHSDDNVLRLCKALVGAGQNDDDNDDDDHE